MTTPQVEALITLASAAAAVALALAQTAKTLLEIADQVRRRRARHRGPRRPRRPRGRAPRRGPLGVAAPRSTRPPGRGPPAPVGVQCYCSIVTTIRERTAAAVTRHVLPAPAPVGVPPAHCYRSLLPRPGNPWPDCPAAAWQIDDARMSCHYAPVSTASTGRLPAQA